MRSTCRALAAAVVLLAAGCGGGPQTHPLETGGIDAVDMLQTLQARTVRVLGTVTGTAAAEAALPELEAISADYGDLLVDAKGLSPAGRAELAEQAARILPGLKDNAVRLGSMRGGTILTPVLGEIIDKVALLQ
ncbi:MAG: hypothetical protein IH621_07515 [Krumholzibacteria bacterium]|nr:hypothetical protein [Candidatus Krumholzibacteria bacterium]